MDPPLEPGSVRWLVLEALGAITWWKSAPQLAVSTGLALETTVRALGSLRELGLVRVVVWAGHTTLHEITDAGRARLAQGAQMALL